uniref:Uncharacterized protein n=1 Tax=Timema douglasi TaxID=61478 RepID=A0A7R8VRK3_TIMDO|nr:unnamed protein product [Timema douglasi]
MLRVAGYGTLFFLRLAGHVFDPCCGSAWACRSVCSITWCTLVPPILAFLAKHLMVLQYMCLSVFRSHGIIWCAMVPPILSFLTKHPMVLQYMCLSVFRSYDHMVRPGASHPGVPRQAPHDAPVHVFVCFQITWCALVPPILSFLAKHPMVLQYMCLSVFRSYDHMVRPGTSHPVVPRQAPHGAPVHVFVCFQIIWCALVPPILAFLAKHPMMLQYMCLSVFRSHDHMVHPGTSHPVVPHQAPHGAPVHVFVCFQITWCALVPPILSFLAKHPMVLQYMCLSVFRSYDHMVRPGASHPVVPRQAPHGAPVHVFVCFQIIWCALVPPILSFLAKHPMVLQYMCLSVFRSHDHMVRPGSSHPVVPRQAPHGAPVHVFVCFQITWCTMVPPILSFLTKHPMVLQYMCLSAFRSHDHMVRPGTSHPVVPRQAPHGAPVHVFVCFQIIWCALVPPILSFLTKHPMVLQYMCLSVFRSHGAPWCLPSWLPHQAPHDAPVHVFVCFQITWCAMVPPILAFLAKHPMVLQYDLRSLTRVGVGAAPVSGDLLRQFKNRFPHIEFIRQGYGMTELTLGALANNASNHDKLESVGKLVPGLEAKVIDESGRSLGAGKSGELCFRGCIVMKGYVNNPSATSQIIDREGWLHTGDVGYYDEEGSFYIVDRLKDLIKYKGFQVPPAEIEAILMSHPGVMDAAVIGVPDEGAGELPKAFVVKKDANVTAQQLVDYVNEPALREQQCSLYLAVPLSFPPPPMCACEQQSNTTSLAL